MTDPFNTLLMNIRRARIGSGLTQERFAEELGVTRSAVAQWESGAIYPTVERLFAISELLGVPVGKLFDRTSADEALIADIERQKARIATIRKNLMKPTDPVYALESIADLIGDRQYRMLCEAVGLNIVGDTLPAGDDFAQAIHSAHERRLRDRDRELQRLERNGLPL